MNSGKCGTSKLCPFSLGLAVGITCALAYFIWSLWLLHYGVPPAMAAAMSGMMIKVPATLADSYVPTFMALVKGFLFGFFIALFYDLFRCLFHWGHCKKSGERCGCCGSAAGCTCGKPGVRDEIR